MTIEPSDVPLYLQLAEKLRQQILSGEISPTQPLPSKRILREEYGVAANTVGHAYEVLKAEHLVRTVRGLGLYPTRPEDRPPRE
jgi:DNA-binding GntR family transcriptional regulator